MLANWLLTAVIKIVTTYSMPGDRILLLTPSPFGMSGRVADRVASNTPRRLDPYRRLEEAAWPVARLGRGVQTATAAPSDEPPTDRARSADRSESGPGSIEPGPDRVSPVGTRRTIITETTGAPDGPFDVIITAAGPRASTLPRLTTWGRLLTPAGVFAAITHSDRHGSRLYDPAGALVRAARQDGLRYLDHIALLQVPVKHGALDGPQAQADPGHPPSGPAMSPALAAGVHADLHVFAAPQAATGGAVNRGDIG